ncbi:MAG TPA: glycerol acyltransferase, partial [Puia sp.]
MARPFLYIYRYFAGHRKIFLTVQIGLFLLTGMTAIKIKPEEDISKILPKDRQAEKLNELLQEARFADKLVLMISLKDSGKISPEIQSAFADSFSILLQSRYPSLVRSVENRMSDSLVPQLMEMVWNHLPVFLESEDYAGMDSLKNPQWIGDLLAQDKKLLSSPAGMILKDRINQDPLGITNPVLKKIRQLQYDENFDLYDGHILSKDGRYMLLFVNPAFPANNTGKNSLLVHAMDQTIDDLQKNGFENVDAIYFGGAAVAVGNAQQLRNDSWLTLGITAVFLIVFISWYFKTKR